MTRMKKLLPIIIILCIVAGFYAGVHICNKERPIIDNSGNKFDYMLNLIEAKYVDGVNIDSLVEKCIPKMLEELDPHSAYIPKEELKAANEDLSGSFSGIGVRFSIQDDTINISEVIRSGPSQQAGILAGDKIITVNDTLFVGKGVCTNENAMKKLKGPKGSYVRLGIKRFGEDELLKFNVRRDDIMIESVEVAYVIDNKWGYIQVDKFGENTFAEFLTKAVELYYNYAQGLIVDLRGNGGGYLEIATLMANQFLEKDETIVYTEGKNSPKKVYSADGTGILRKFPLVILVDETSASASEVLAGAIQDNDRGTIIGRRTFGKGLVQEQMMLPDGSAVRLTIARYHTPSGRCIQKAYTNGEREEYAMDIIDRYNRGEFFSQDSIVLDKEHEYRTKGGRTVYGGGGIMPDIFVPSDSTTITKYCENVIRQGVSAQFALKYSNQNRQRLSHCNTYSLLLEELNKEAIYDQFVEFAKEKGVTADLDEIIESKEVLEDNLRLNIIYMLLNMQEYVRYRNIDDPIVKKAIEVLENGESYPTVK